MFEAPPTRRKRRHVDWGQNDHNLTPILTPISANLDGIGGTGRTSGMRKQAEKAMGGTQRTPPGRIRNQQVVGSSPTAGSIVLRTQWTPHGLACCGWATSVEDGGMFSVIRAGG